MVLKFKYQVLHNENLIIYNLPSLILQLNSDIIIEII